MQCVSFYKFFSSYNNCGRTAITFQSLLATRVVYLFAMTTYTVRKPRIEMGADGMLYLVHQVSPPQPRGFVLPPPPPMQPVKFKGHMESSDIAHLDPSAACNVRLVRGILGTSRLVGS